MKKVILLLLLISMNGFSQTNGKIYFKNGNIFEGTIEKRSTLLGSMIDTRIIYEPEEGRKVEKWSVDIDKIELLSDGNKEVTSVFYFKEVNNQMILVEKIGTRGDLHLFLGHSTLGISDLVPGYTLPTTDFKLIEEYFIGTEDAVKLEKFHQRMSSKKFKSLLIKYMGKTKCDQLDDILKKYQKTKKVKKREFFNELESVCN